MWDLATIIRMNNEAFRSAKEKNSAKTCLEASIERNEGIWNPEKGIFGKVTYLRSVYEGEIDRHPSQGGEGETLP
jgi:hypothetical protein